MDLENVVLDQKSTQVLVESCENLIELRLQCPSLNDLQLVEFNRCRRLESVTIRSGNITDSSLSAVLVRAKQLSFIELEGRGIDGSFLSKMEGDLSWLRLDNCDITDEGMKGLRHVPRVEILSIKHSGNVTDEGIKIISFLKGLTGLDLSGTKITKRGLALLAGLESLDTLVLDDCKGIDDDCIATIGAFQSISRLSIQNTSLTEAGIRRLRQDMPDCTIAVTDLERWVNPFTGTILNLN